MLGLEHHYTYNNCEEYLANCRKEIQQFPEEIQRELKHLLKNTSLSKKQLVKRFKPLLEQSEDSTKKELRSICCAKIAMKAIDSEPFTLESVKAFISSLESRMISEKINLSWDISRFCFFLDMFIQKLERFKETNNAYKHIRKLNRLVSIDDFDYIKGLMRMKYNVIFTKGFDDEDYEATKKFLKEVLRMMKRNDFGNYFQAHIQATLTSCNNFLEIVDWKNEEIEYIKGLIEIINPERNDYGKSNIVAYQKHQIDFDGENPNDYHSYLRDVEIKVTYGYLQDTNDRVAIKEYIYNEDLPVYVSPEIEIFRELSGKDTTFLKFYGVYDSAFQGKKTRGLIMEAGIQSLRRELESKMEAMDYYSERHLKEIALKLINGISIMHENDICHLDIKLDNLLRGTDKNIKICDFNTSMFINEHQGDYSIKGTIGYMAPEILSSHITPLSAQTYDIKKADSYSLGICLLQLHELKYREFLTSEFTDILKYREKIRYNWLRNLVIALLKLNPQERCSMKRAKEIIAFEDN